MSELVLTTYDWVPAPPRGFVRDLRIRWALEEAGLPYKIATTPFETRGEAHLAHQPFAQVPWLTDGDVSMFESGAMLLYVAERSEALLPSAPRARAATLSWVFAALNSVEMMSLPWSLLAFSPETRTAAEKERWDGLIKLRLDRMEPVLAGREWLVEGRFSAADVLMADVLRLPDRFDGLAGYPACRAYVARATKRPAFAKAHADQLALYAAADRTRAAA